MGKLVDEERQSVGSNDAQLAYKLIDVDDIKEQLEKHLKGVEVRIYNENQYRFLLNTLRFAGCEIWPWHKGYKPLDEEEVEKFGVYGWEEAGFMKQIYNCIHTDVERTVSQVAQIIEDVLMGKEPELSVHGNIN